MNPEDLPTATAPHEMDALECFTQQLTYYEHRHLLEQQRVAMEAGRVSQWVYTQTIAGHSPVSLEL